MTPLHVIGQGIAGDRWRDHDRALGLKAAELQKGDPTGEGFAALTNQLH